MFARKNKKTGELLVNIRKQRAERGRLLGGAPSEMPRLSAGAFLSLNLRIAG
jgi:hypothetical protein